MMSSHPGVAALLDTYETEVAVYLILELCTGGTLLDRVCMQDRITGLCASDR